MPGTAAATAADKQNIRVYPRTFNDEFTVVGENMNRVRVRSDDIERNFAAGRVSSSESAGRSKNCKGCKRKFHLILLVI